MLRWRFFFFCGGGFFFCCCGRFFGPVVTFLLDVVIFVDVVVVVDVPLWCMPFAYGFCCMAFVGVPFP